MEDYSDYFELRKINDGSYELTLLNIWNKQILTSNIKKLEKLTFSSRTKLTVDFQNLKECDTASIIYLISFFKKVEEKNLTLKNLDSFEEFYRFYEKHYQENNLEIKDKKNIIEKIGKTVYEAYLSSLDFTKFVGKSFYYFVYSLFNPKKMRLRAMLKYIDTSAVNALFIVGITSFLVGVEFGFHADVHIEKLGANIF